MDVLLSIILYVLTLLFPGMDTYFDADGISQIEIDVQRSIVNIYYDDGTDVELVLEK